MEVGLWPASSKETNGFQRSLTFGGVKGQRPLDVPILDERRAPVVGAFGACDVVRPSDLAVGQGVFDELGEVLLCGVLAMGHDSIDVDDDGVFELHGEEMLLLACDGGTVPTHLCVGEDLTRGQSVVHQRRRLIEGGGELEGLVNTLTRRLTRLRVAGDRYRVIERLNHDFVFMTFDVDVTN